MHLKQMTAEFIYFTWNNCFAFESQFYYCLTILYCFPLKHPQTEAPAVPWGRLSSAVPVGKPEVRGQNSAEWYYRDGVNAFVQIEALLLLYQTSHTHHECLLLLGSLETAVTEFGRCVDELKLNGLIGLARRVHE